MRYETFQSGSYYQSRTKAELNPGILEEIRNQGLDLIGVVPQDEAVYEYDCDGKPTVTLPEDNPMRKAAFEIFDKLGL